MALAKAPRISDAEWEHARPYIHDLYINEKMSLPGNEDEDGVMQIMKNRYNFVATEQQYRRRFKTWWKWSKNAKKKDIEVLSKYLAVRTASGKRSEIYKWGEQVLETKFGKIKSTSLRNQNLSTQLPRGYVIRTPIMSPCRPMWLSNIPFFNLESSLYEKHTNQSFVKSRDNTDSISKLHLYENLQVDGLDTTWPVIQSPLRFYERHLSLQKLTTQEKASLTASLRFVMPMQDTWLAASLDTQLCRALLQRQVLFSIANNFCGLDSLSPKRVFQLLDEEQNMEIYRSILLVSDYSSKALAENLLKVAIEAGNATIVHLLLEDENADIDIKQQALSINGQRYTLIERAAYLGHDDVIRLLLKYGADVNQTFPGSPYSGALSYYIGSHIYHAHPDLMICQLFLDADGFSYNAFLEACQAKDKRILLLCLGYISDAHLRTHRGYLDRLSMVVKDSGIETAMKVITSLCSRPDIAKFPRIIDMLDFAALRGSMQLVKPLLSVGIQPTTKTVCYAIASGNIQLVQFILSKGGSLHVEELDPDRLATPLAAAISTNSQTMLNFVLEQGVRDDIYAPSHLESMLRLAAKAGNVEMFKFLLKIGDKLSCRQYSAVLCSAVRSNQFSLALLVIELGAILNLGLYYDAPLTFVECLAKRNMLLINCLLDAGQHPDEGYELFTEGEHKPLTAVMQTVSWGDQVLTKRIIDAGGDVNLVSANSSGLKSPLSIAVHQKDFAMMQMLLTAGADINGHQKLKDVYATENLSALQVAVRDDDSEMLRYLLEHGADPYDTPALAEAFSSDNEAMIELLLEAFKARYPYGRKRYGAVVLIRATESGKLDTIARLLKAGLDPSQMLWKDKMGMSPFGSSIVMQQGRCLSMVEVFLKSGCHPDSVVSEPDPDDFEGSCPRTTAFLAAISTGSTSMVKLLARYGADVDHAAIGRIQRTPMQRAAETGDLEMMECLYRLGSDIHSPASPRGGGTALQLAALGGYCQLVNWLLSHGAKVDAPGSKAFGMTALETAAKSGRIDMVQLLLNAGAAAHGQDISQINRAAELATENGHIQTSKVLQSRSQSQISTVPQTSKLLQVWFQSPMTPAPQTEESWEDYIDYTGCE